MLLFIPFWGLVCILHKYYNHMHMICLWCSYHMPCYTGTGPCDVMAMALPNQVGRFWDHWATAFRQSWLMAMERERTFTLPSLGHFPIQSYYNRPNIIKSHLHIRFDVPFASIKKKIYCESRLHSSSGHVGQDWAACNGSAKLGVGEIIQEDQEW